MGPYLGRDAQGLPPVLGGVDLVAFAYEIVLHEFEDVGLVVDQQDAVAHGDGSVSACRGFFVRR